MSTSSRQWSDEGAAILTEFQDGRSHFAVIARAGTGKTTICVEGISRAPEAKKCYLAFNKKNVDEAKTKITDSRCQVKSLNGLGFSYVLQNLKGVKPDDDVDFDRISAVINSNLTLKAKKYPPRALIKEILNYAKNTQPFADQAAVLKMAEAKGFSPEDYQEEQGWTVELICEVAYKAMQAAKTPDRQNRISFNDQLWLPVVMKWVRPWFDMVVVDECQDMNTTQLYLAEGACKKAGRIVLVGDPRQAIYAFRGATVGGMEHLQKKLRAKTFPLTITYRCPKAVVELAQILVPDYKAAAKAPAGTVRRLQNADKLADEVRGGDAVLSRFNAPLVPHCLTLLKKKIRAYIEGRDVGRTLTAIHQKLPTTSVRAYLDALDSWAAEKINRVTGNVESDTYKAAIQLIEDQAATLKALAEDAADISVVTSTLSTLFDDTTPNSPKAVVFSSVHKAKGLEWSRVFLLANTFKGMSWTSLVTENQNILYVALTRSKSELCWVGEGGPSTGRQEEIKDPTEVECACGLEMVEHGPQNDCPRIPENEVDIFFPDDVE